MGEPELLLTALAKFVDQELRPAVADPGLAFRARIAASLLRSLASERPAEREIAEIEASLAPLVARLRDGTLDAGSEAALRRAVRQLLRGQVQARSPEVDLDEPGA